MHSLTNRFKQMLATREMTYGLWFGLANNVAAEICAQSGFDWLLIDAEHSPLSDGNILSCLQAVAPYDIAPIVRPLSGHPDNLKRLCDIGAQSFLVPMIENAAQAEAVVRAVRYPPHGKRGLGTSMARAAAWNRQQDYLIRANDEMCVILQVETKDGLANLSEIVKVEGVDAVFIGPSDLGADLGYIGDPKHPELVETVTRAIRDICGAGKFAGVLAIDAELAKAYARAGATFIGIGSDCGVLAQGTAQLYQSFIAGGEVKGVY